jgi:hypothetical protein
MKLHDRWDEYRNIPSGYLDIAQTRRELSQKMSSVIPEVRQAQVEYIIFGLLPTNDLSIIYLQEYLTTQLNLLNVNVQRYPGISLTKAKTNAESLVNAINGLTDPAMVDHTLSYFQDLSERETKILLDIEKRLDGREPLFNQSEQALFPNRNILNSYGLLSHNIRILRGRIANCEAVPLHLARYYENKYLYSQ